MPLFLLNHRWLIFYAITRTGSAANPKPVSIQRENFLTMFLVLVIKWNWFTKFPDYFELYYDLVFASLSATFVLHHQEDGHAVILPIISCIIDSTLEYDRNDPPFASFISLVYPDNENEYSEQWALACGEILSILTHYNRPIYKVEHRENEADRKSSGSHASTCRSIDGEPSLPPPHQSERKPFRPLSPWITDILLAAPLGIRSDYFRWCGGVTGKYAARELKPPSIV